MEPALDLTRGTAKECLAHYFATEWNGHSRIALAHLAGCHIKSVGGWSRGTTIPKGENLLRVTHYLALLGYSVVELDRIDLDVRRLGQMILLGIRTIHDLADTLEYSGTTVAERHSELYRILLRGGGMTAKRAQQVKILVSEHAGTLESALAEFEKKRPRVRNQSPTFPPGLSPGQGTSPRRIPTQVKVQGSTARDEASNNVQVSIAAGLVQSLLQHVQRFANHDKQHLEAFRKRSPEMRELGEYLLAIASKTI